MSAAPNFIEVTPKNWKEAKLLGDLIKKYNMFRGQADSKWPLETTLLRAVANNPDSSLSIIEQELYVLKIFKARAHQYIQSPPKDNEHIEWLSLIQDHGGPTRLLDFTESFYIASFFALESIKDEGSVWAIHQWKLFASLISNSEGGKLLTEKRLKSGKTYLGNLEELIRFAETFIDKDNKHANLIIKVVPPRLNERLAVQRGIFLFPCNVNESFEFNLCKTFELPFDNLDSVNATKLNCQEFLKIYNQLDHTDLLEVVPVIKINLTKKLRDEALSDLFNMNIDHASLFPGLDGFAKSLNLHLGNLRNIESFVVRYQDDEDTK